MKKIKEITKSGKGITLLLVLSLTCSFAILAKSSLNGKVLAESKKGDNQTLSRYTFANLVEKLSPSVVNIYTTQIIKGGGRFFRFFDNEPRGDRGPNQDDRNKDRERRGENPFFGFFGDDFFERFHGFSGDVPQGDVKETSLGCGFVLSDDGYIVTNNHVVEKATEIKVKLLNEDEYEAKVVGKDKQTDLALIKIKPKKPLAAVKLGNSSSLKVGEWVVAIGNPFGLSNSVTKGIVSAMGRSLHTGPYDDFIQTDASINPGNSGGPLINLDGEVVGVNTAIVAPPAQGIGFAIPIDLAKNIISQLKSKGKVVRGWLGVAIQEITPELKKSFNLKTVEGALVAEVFKDSPAESAKIQRGDVIINFDGKKVAKYGDLSRIVADTQIGKMVDLELLRNNERVTMKVKVAERKEGEEGVVLGSATEEKLGVKVQDLNDDLKKSLGLKADEKGVVVIDVNPSSLAYEQGLRRDDIIKEVRVNGERVVIDSVKDFEKASEKVKKDDVLAFLIKRKDTTIYIAFTVK